MKNKIALMSSIILALLLVSLVSGFGVSQPYWEGKPLKMYPGETKIITLNVENGAGATEDVTARMKITKGLDIASLEKNDYLVKAGENIDVPVTIRIPDNATINTTYPIRIETKTVTPGVEGAVSMGIGMGSSFNVIIKEKPKQQLPAEKPKVKLAMILIVIIVIILIIAIAIIFRRKFTRKLKNLKRNVE